MRPDVLMRLLEINDRFYRDFGAAFSATRQRVQPGVKRLLEMLPLTGRWLDIGCGNGELGRELQRHGFDGEYWGVDGSREMLGKKCGENDREESPHPLHPLSVNGEGASHGETDAREEPHPLHPLSANGEGAGRGETDAREEPHPLHPLSVNGEGASHGETDAREEPHSLHPLSVNGEGASHGETDAREEPHPLHPLSVNGEGASHGETDAREEPHPLHPLSVNGEGGGGVRYDAIAHHKGERYELWVQTHDVNHYPYDIARPNLWLSHPVLWEKLKPLARELRHEPTPAEKILWQCLRDRQVSNAKFRRQHAIGQFLVDFYCAEVNLVVEVDGPIHQYTVEEDAIRQEFLETLGITVLRYTNAQVIKNIRPVLKEIGDIIITLRQRVKSPYPLHPLSVNGEGGGGVRYDTNIQPARKSKIHLLLANLADPAWVTCLPPGRYETITAFAVLHHIPSDGLRKRLLRQVAELLAPGGRFILSVWQFHHSPKLMGRQVGWESVGLAEADLEPGDTLLDWRFALPGQAEQRGLRYVHLFTPEELAALAAAAGFAIRQTFESDGHGGRLGLYQVWERAG